VRVYLPATIAMLESLVSEEKFSPIGGTGFALTPALRESYTSGSTEELEYAALLDASRASLRLIAGEEKKDHPARRVVIAVDVEDATTTMRPDLDSSVVRLAGPVDKKDIAAIHVDTGEAEKAVRAAAEVIDAADLGDSDAEFILGDAEDHELAWYAVQELPFLLELL
jgi:hypothetical protein